jgi:hypothetical protein
LKYLNAKSSKRCFDLAPLITKPLFPKCYLTERGKVFRRHTPMGPTLIIECSRFGNLFLAADNQKTRTCPYCGTRVNVRKAKKIASATNAYEASEMLREIKSRKGFSRQ